MAVYAVLDGGVVVGWRDIADWDNYPVHKKSANDEKGDGGSVLRLRVIEGSGPNEQIIIEPAQVRVVRSTPMPTKTDLIATAAAKRWSIQSSGINVGGAAVDTSTESLALITGAIEGLERGWNTEPIRFKAKTGWVDLTLLQLQGVGAAITQHVQACFVAESAVVAKINNDTYTTTAHVNDASEWPG